MAQRSFSSDQDSPANRSWTSVRARSGLGVGGWVLVCAVSALTLGCGAADVAAQVASTTPSSKRAVHSASQPQRKQAARPKLFPWLTKFVEAKGDDAQRDQILSAQRHNLVDGFRRLTEAAVEVQLGLAAFEDNDPIEALHDFGARAEKLFGLSVFAEDAKLVLGLPERQMARRSRATKSLYSKLTALMRIASANPAPHFEDGNTIAPALAQRWESLHLEATKTLNALEKLANRLDDNDLLRTVLAFRPLAIRLGTQGVDSALRDQRLKPLGALIEGLSEQGLGSDSRVFFAFRERMQIWLAKHDLASAERELGHARRTLKPESLRPSLFATWLETELSYFIEQGFDYAISNAADRMAGLLPTLRESLPGYEDSLQRRTVSEAIAGWSYQVAYAQSLAGTHAKAWETLAKLRELPHIAPETLANVNLLASVEAETLGLWDESIKAARAVLGSPAAPEKRWQAQVQIAATESLRGNVAEAASALSDAQRSQSRLKNIKVASRLMSRSYLVAARVERMQGNLEEALEASREALSHADKSGHVLETTRVLWFSSALHLQTGNPKRALDEARQAQELSRGAKISAEWQQFVSDLVLADVYLSLGRPSDALDTLNVCGSRENEFLADLKSLRGEFGRLSAQAQWIELRRKLLDSIARLDSSANVSAPGAKTRSSEQVVIERNQDEIDALIEQIRRSIEDLKTHSPRRFDLPGAATETLKSFELLFEITLRTQTSDRALDVARAAEAYTASLKRPAGSHRNLAWREVDAQAAIIRGLAALEEQSIDAALRHFAKAKSLEGRVRGQLRWHAPDGLSARFESLTDRMIALHMEAACMQSSSAARVDEAIFFLANERAQGLRSYLDGVSRSGGRDLKPSAPNALTPKTLNALRADHRLILVYAITGRGSYVVAIKGDHTAVHRLSLPGHGSKAAHTAGESQRIGLSRMTEMLTEAMVAPAQLHARSSFLHFSKVLYRFLLAPVEPLLADTEEIIVVGDGDVHRVPFAALVQCDSPQDKVSHLPLNQIPFLALRKNLKSISSVPSLATFASLEKRRHVKAKKSILLVGNPHTGSSPYPPLGKAQEEVQVVGAMYGANEATILQGSGATFNDLKSAVRGEFGILHIAAHTETKPQPVMLLAPESPGGSMREVDGGEIMSLDLSHTNLVVLSACRSHMGPQLGAEGLLNLPRAFLIAGARHVMASVANVRDSQTSTFMRKFYEHLRNSDGKRGAAAALLETQRDLLLSGEAPLPLGWAPFVIIGTPPKSSR